MFSLSWHPLFWRGKSWGKMCEKVRTSVNIFETILPFSCCPLVFTWSDNDEVCICNCFLGAPTQNYKICICNPAVNCKIIKVGHYNCVTNSEKNVSVCIKFATHGIEGMLKPRKTTSTKTLLIKHDAPVHNMIWVIVLLQNLLCSSGICISDAGSLWTFTSMSAHYANRYQFQNMELLQYYRWSRHISPGCLQKCVADFCCAKTLEEFAGDFSGGFSGHFFPTKMRGYKSGET